MAKISLILPLALLSLNATTESQAERKLSDYCTSDILVLQEALALNGDKEAADAINEYIWNHCSLSEDDVYEAIEKG
jgi:hypothetical protein